MYTVSKEGFAEFEEKKSKFIGYIKPVSSKIEAEEFINLIKQKHYDARHNAFAYKLIENGQEYFKFSDDGEPSNTAGKPIAEIINLKNVSNLVIVVSRYFGGIKLGAGGLIRNYAKSAKLAIESVEILELKEKKEILIDFDYSKINEIDNFINNFEASIIYKNFETRVTYKILLEEKYLEKLREINNLIII